ncbi:hypothetical protein MCOR02_004320 [Pyricularia oryzae]|nr:hypothetical protein MCOR02_004320 [Pyricularia oryzae]
MLQALKTYFEARLKEKDIAAEIQARVKQVESIKTTLERREKIKPFASVSDVFVEMHDLLGLRIVPRHSAARKKAEAFLNEEFRQLKPSAHISSERKVGEFWDVRFGAFQSYNHRLGLGEKSDQTVALSPYAGVMFEVQLTTWSKRVYNIIAHKLLYKGTQSLNKQAELSLDTLDGLTGLVEAQLQGLMDALEASVEESHNADISKLAEAKETALNRLNEIGPEVRAAIEDAFIGLADSLAANIPTDADAGQNLIDQLPEQRKPLVSALRQFIFEWHQHLGRLEKKIMQGSLKSFQRQELETAGELADEWILKNHYPNRLKIERLSGELLSMDQCYVNLAILERPGRGLGRLDKQPGEDTPPQTSPFSMFAILKTETPDKNIQVQLPTLFNPRKGRENHPTRPKRILIRGQAGIGKTTLCKKIVHDFIFCHIWKDLFDRILWVPLRVLKGKPDYTLECLFLQQFFAETSDREDFAKQLEKTVEREKERTLFVLDGLDEVSEGLISGNERYRCLKSLLNQPNVIITSRPSALFEDLSPDLELETIGFYPYQLEDYKKKPSENKKTSTGFRGFFNKGRLFRALYGSQFCWMRSVSPGTTAPLPILQQKP